MTSLTRPAALCYAVRIVFWLTVAFTFACAEMPAGSAPHLFPWDKAEHFVAFYVLSCLAAAAYPRIPLVILALWLSLFGSTIELVQALPFIHRDCDIWDWIADMLAVSAALAPMTLSSWRTTALSATN